MAIGHSGIDPEAWGRQIGNRRVGCEADGIHAYIPSAVRECKDHKPAMHRIDLLDENLHGCVDAIIRRRGIDGHAILRSRQVWRGVGNVLQPGIVERVVMDGNGIVLESSRIP